VYGRLGRLHLIENGSRKKLIQTNYNGLLVNVLEKKLHNEELLRRMRLEFITIMRIQNGVWSKEIRIHTSLKISWSNLRKNNYGNRFLGFE
jgi:hypothetical protein